MWKNLIEGVSAKQRKVAGKTKAKRFLPPAKSATKK